MKERTLMKCALISSILGIMFLFYLSENVILPEVNSVDIEVGSGMVLFEGEIVNVREMENLVIYDLRSEAIVSGVIYGEHSAYKIGDKVSVIGEIDDYNGKKQLIIEEIK